MKNKKILITGASSGLGRALSIELDKLGANLFLTGRSSNELDQTLSLLKNNNHQSFIYDLCDINNLSSLLTEAFNDDTPYDGFVHCAGVHTFFPINFLKKEHIQEAFDVNIIAPTLMIKEFSKKGNFNANSSIIFISSVMGVMGSSSLSIYSASKAAQVGLTKSLAVELSKKKIRVNSISASMLDSKILTKVKTKTSSDSFNEIEKKHLLGLGDYNDVVPSIVHYLSEDSNWVTGSNIFVDGGYSAW